MNCFWYYDTSWCNVCLTKNIWTVSLINSRFNSPPFLTKTYCMNYWYEVSSVTKKSPFNLEYLWTCMTNQVLMPNISSYIIVCFFGTFWNEMLLLRRDSNTLNSAFLPTQNRYPIWVLVNLWKIKQYNCMGFLLPNYCDFMKWNLATIYWRCFRGRKENKFLMSHFEKTLQDMLKPFFHEITYWCVNIFLLEEQENEPL